jgi:hypothetical protein
MINRIVEEWDEMLNQSWAQSLPDGWQIALSIAAVITLAVVLIASYPNKKK